MLTASYLQGGFEDFQSLLSQHQSWETRVARFIPLMRRPCRPSMGVQLIMQPLLDVSNDAEVDAGLQRLAIALREPPLPSFDA